MSDEVQILEWVGDVLFADGWKVASIYPSSQTPDAWDITVNFKDPNKTPQVLVRYGGTCRTRYLAMEAAEKWAWSSRA